MFIQFHVPYKMAQSEENCPHFGFQKLGKSGLFQYLQIAGFSQDSFYKNPYF